MALVARGLLPSREAARRAVLDGLVLVDGRPARKPAERVGPGTALRLLRAPRFVGRGGEKLEAALDTFRIDVAGLVCADAGASTGGFTDCLLQRGAARVHAVDVGRAQLHPRLCADARVVAREGVDVRDLADLGEPAGFAAVDVAFIPLRLVLPAVRRWLAPGARAVALVKPQFEAGRGAVGRAGVVRDPAVHERVLGEALRAARAAGFQPDGLRASPLRGGEGNAEFLLALATGAGGPFDADAAVRAALRAVHG